METPCKSIKVHSNSSINALKSIPNTNFVITGGGNDNLVKLTHTDGEVIQFPTEHLGSINAVDSYDELIISGGNHDGLVLWDLVKQAKLRKLTTDSTSILNNNVMDVKLYQDLLILCGTNSQLNFHDLRVPNSKPVTVLKDAADALTLFDYTPSSNHIYAASLDGKIYTYDLRKSEVLYSSKDLTSDGIINIAEFEKYLLVTYESGRVELITTNNRALINRFENTHRHNREKLHYFTNSIIFNDYHNISSKYISSGSESETVNIWKWGGEETTLHKKLKITSKHSTSHASHPKILNRVSMLYSSNKFVCSTNDGYIHIWDNVI